MEENLGGFNLNQVVNFETWTRTINGIVKQSILDHILNNGHRYKIIANGHSGR